MDFKDEINQLATQIEQLKDRITTEEATKNAFIMPFINALGYNVFNPLEVVPEMDCDLIKKKGEKIDYAIMKDSEPIMLIECKHWKQDLTLHDNQLQKYFVASKAKFGVLTNGIFYRFYTDLVKANIMDDKPFLEVNITELKDFHFDELKKFHKSYFDIDNILSSASELKYMGELKSAISQEFTNPTPDFVKYFGKQVYDGQFTSKITEQFTSLVKRTIGSHINDMISERLKAAMKNEEQQHPAIVAEQENLKQPSTGATTTDEELEGFYLVKSVLRNIISAERITYRDSQTYFAILIDDNNRKGICRLYFNSEGTKKISIIDENKKETFYKISSLDDIYSCHEELIKSAQRFA